MHRLRLLTLQIGARPPARGAWRRPLVLIAMAVGIAALFTPGRASPDRPGSLRLIFNASDSAPRGFYAVRSVAFAPGDWIVTRLPAHAVALAAARQYLPSNVPILKPIVAAYGDHVCVRDGLVRVNGRVLAVTRTYDRQGRALTAWPGCRLLAEDELFLLNPMHATSFDSRYFGPVQRMAAYGQAAPLWVW